MPKLNTIEISTLLDAGVHFGHKASRWNPKMAPYIYGVRDDVHVIDLQQTAVLMQRALNVIYETVKKNGKILFVSTKIQASDIVAECAEKCGQYYVNHRWLGGMLTNWGTISGSIKKLDALEKILDNEEECSGYTKKELLEMTRKKDKLLRSLGGIRNIGTKPNLIIVIDTNKEHLAIEEAVKLGIPIVAIVDTNCDPDKINYPIPGNDDAIRSIKLYCNLFADAVLAGIQEALEASGVDLGSLAINEEKGGGISGIAKFKSTKKFSKNADMSAEKVTGFEDALKHAENVQEN
jgi:small subunit ribosomal protein S2